MIPVWSKTISEGYGNKFVCTQCIGKVCHTTMPYNMPEPTDCMEEDND